MKLSEISKNLKRADKENAGKAYDDYLPTISMTQPVTQTGFDYHLRICRSKKEGQLYFTGPFFLTCFGYRDTVRIYEKTSGRIYKAFTNPTNDAAIRDFNEVKQVAERTGEEPVEGLTALLGVQAPKNSLTTADGGFASVSLSTPCLLDLYKTTLEYWRIPLASADYGDGNYILVYVSDHSINLIKMRNGGHKILTNFKLKTQYEPFSMVDDDDSEVKKHFSVGAEVLNSALGRAFDNKMSSVEKFLNS